MNIYRYAWGLFKEQVTAKNSWGKNEIAALMAECMEEAVSMAEDGKDPWK